MPAPNGQTLTVQLLLPGMAVLAECLRLMDQLSDTEVLEVQSAAQERLASTSGPRQSFNLVTVKSMMRHTWGGDETKKPEMEPGTCRPLNTKKPETEPATCRPLNTKKPGKDRPTEPPGVPRGGPPIDRPVSVARVPFLASSQPRRVHAKNHPRSSA